MTSIRSNLKDISVALRNIAYRLFEGWSIWKVLNFSNFLKIAFIYIAAIMWVIIIEFEYSDGFWKNAINHQFSEKRISIYSTQQRIGEGVLYSRIMQYIKDQSYDYSSCRFPESLTSHFSLASHFYRMGANILNYILQPQLNLSITHHVSVVPDIGYNIVYLNMSRDDLFNAYGRFQKRWSHLEDYDAYADLYTLSNGQNKLLQDIIDSSGRRKPIIPLYLSQLKTSYKKPDFYKALISGSLWGCSRGSLRIKLALKKLAEDNMLDAIGLPEFEYLGDHYKGRMEHYGNILHSIIKQHQKYGISLIIHNQEHRLDGIPTSRISESVSSGAIIISDRNKFLERYFSDEVLFIDIDQGEDEIYYQIKNHIEWIKSNPDQAQEMSERAFNIFNEHFTIEKQMQNLFDFIASTNN